MGSRDGEKGGRKKRTIPGGRRGSSIIREQGLNSMWWWWWWWWWEETGGRGKPGIGEEEEEEAFAPLRFPLLPGSSPTLLLLLLDPPNTVQHGLAAAVASLHLSPRSDSVFPLLGFTTFIGLSKNECCMVGRSGGRGGIGPGDQCSSVRPERCRRRSICKTCPAREKGIYFQVPFFPLPSSLSRSLIAAFATLPPPFA